MEIRRDKLHHTVSPSQNILSRVQHFSICANSKLEYFKYTPAYYNSLNTIYIDYACGLDFFDWSCDINVEKKLIRIRDLKSTILLLDNLEIEEEEGS